LNHYNIINRILQRRYDVGSLGDKLKHKLTFVQDCQQKLKDGKTEKEIIELYETKNT